MSDTKAVIGFIGVGLMGHGMAKNLVTKGYPLVDHGPPQSRAGGAPEVARRARGRHARASCAQACDIVHLCVTGSPQVEALVRGPDGLLAGREAWHGDHRLLHLQPGVDAGAGRRRRRARGVHFVDAPLSRTPKEAEAGTLDTMVGADARGLRAHRAGAALLGRQRGAPRAGGPGPQDEADQQLRRDGLCGAVLRGAGDRAQGRAVDRAVPCGDRLGPHAQPVLRHLHAVVADRRRERAPLHHQQRAQGHALPRQHGRRAGRGEPDPGRREEPVRRDGSRRPGRALRADAGRLRRRHQRAAAGPTADSRRSRHDEEEGTAANCAASNGSAARTATASPTAAGSRARACRTTSSTAGR